jgi:hypothetical protein
MRFQVSTEASTKMTAFQDIGPCSLVEVDRCFRVRTAIIRAIYSTSVYFNETTRSYIPQICLVVVVHVDGVRRCSELRPRMDLLFIPQTIYGYVEPWGKLKNSEKTLSQGYLFHQKSNMDWPGREPGPPQ